MFRPIPGTWPFGMEAGTVPSSSAPAAGNAVQQAVGPRPTFAPASSGASFGGQLASGLGSGAGLSPVLLVALVVLVLVAVQ